jgi:hypothetical protein
MAPYSRWVLASFKQTLIDACDEYMKTTDRGTDKSRSTLITRISNEITEITSAKKEELPDDLEKVRLLSSPHHMDNNAYFQSVRTWFGNYASGYSKDKPDKSKVDTRGHPTSVKAWNAKSVCRYIFTDRISDEQKKLSDQGEKDIGKYQPALTSIFDALSEAELKTCQDLAVEWNTKGLPEEIQMRQVIYCSVIQSFNDSHADYQRIFRLTLWTS